MKKTLIFALLTVIIGSIFAGSVNVFAKQGADDKWEKEDRGFSSALSASDDKLNRLAPSVVGLNKIASPQDSKFTVSVKADGTVKVQGKVVASPSAAAVNRISVQSWFGTYTVDATNAKILRRYGGQGSIADIQIGDIIVFDGKANQTDMTITATTIRDLSSWAKDVDWVGDISNIDSTSRTFMFTIPGSPNQDRKPITLKVTANADAKIRIGSSEVQFSSLANGMRARVYGLYNVNTQSISARRIDARNVVNPNPIITTTSSATSTAQ